MAIVEETDEEIAVIIYHPEEESTKETIAEAILNFLVQYSQKIPDNFVEKLLKNMEINIR